MFISKLKNKKKKILSEKALKTMKIEEAKISSEHFKALCLQKGQEFPEFTNI